MNLRTLFLVCLILTFMLSDIFGQQQPNDDPEETHVVIATGRVLANGVELRWYPGTAGIWRHANQHGYLIERMELSDVGERSGWQRIGGTSIKPYTAEEWRTRTDNANDYVKAASRAILEPTQPPVANADFDSWKAYNDQENGVFLFFTLATNLHPDAAYGAALRYMDTSVEKGKGYVYRISVPTWKGKVDAKYGMVVIENTRDTYDAPAVTGIRAEELEGAVRIFWPSDPNEILFPTFHVERSVDGKDWKRLNRLPIFFGSAETELFFYTDSVTNYKPHLYRVVGITPFADSGKPSESIKAIARDRTPPAGATNTRAEGNRKSILVTWEMPKPSSDLAGFMIGRSAESSGPFAIINEKILSHATKSFVDTKPAVREPFYIVWSVDTAGNQGAAVAAMAFVKDNDPPARPVGLSGYCDTTGVVRLTWTGNTEEDLEGYHVLTANSRTDVFRPLTGRPVMLTEWTDTINLSALNRPVYYKITAVDFNNNPSSFSEVLEVLRPDMIPPAAPVITRYAVSDGKILLEWHNSPSTDVISHALEREDPATGKRQIIKRFDKESIRSFTDESVSQGGNYVYRLIATDDAGWQTHSDPLAASIYDLGVRPGVNNLRITADDSGSQILLTWEYATIKDDHRFVIYRRTGEDDTRSYRSVPSDTFRFQDQMNENIRYQYAIKVIYVSGAESPLSSWVSL